MIRVCVVMVCAAVITLFLSSCGPSKETTADLSTLKEVKPVTSTFKILSINTMHALQDNSDIAKFASWVKGIGPDVIAVQEIERATESKPGFDAVTVLAKTLDMQSYFGKARYFKGWDSGNALFSPYQIRQSNVFSLPVGKGKIRRSLAYGVVDIGIRQLGVSSTELDGESISERMKQADEICSLEGSLKDYPLVVGGDFGESAEGKTLEKMGSTFSIANAVDASTKNINQHIYVASDSAIQILSAEKLEYHGMSNAGVLVTLQISQ